MFEIVLHSDLVSMTVLYVVYWFSLIDHQKLEREARICRLLKHQNIGETPCYLLRITCFIIHSSCYLFLITYLLFLIYFLLLTF